MQCVMGAVSDFLASDFDSISLRHVWYFELISEHIVFICCASYINMAWVCCFQNNLACDLQSFSEWWTVFLCKHLQCLCLHGKKIFSYSIFLSNFLVTFLKQDAFTWEAKWLKSCFSKIISNFCSKQEQISSNGVRKIILIQRGNNIIILAPLADIFAHIKKKKQSWWGFFSQKTRLNILNHFVSL